MEIFHNYILSINDSNLEYSTPLNASKVSHNQINREKKKALARTTQPQKLTKILKRDGCIYPLFIKLFFKKKNKQIITWSISLPSSCTINITRAHLKKNKSYEVGSLIICRPIRYSKTKLYIEWRRRMSQTLTNLNSTNLEF